LYYENSFKEMMRKGKEKGSIEKGMKLRERERRESQR